MDGELAEELEAALSELGRPPAENHFAHVLVWRATAELTRRANRNHDRMGDLEDALSHANPGHHRTLTLPVAAAASLAVDIGEDEGLSEEERDALWLFAWSYPAASRRGEPAHTAIAR